MLISLAFAVLLSLLAVLFLCSSAAFSFRTQSYVPENAFSDIRIGKTCLLGLMSDELNVELIPWLIRIEHRI